MRHIETSTKEHEIARAAVELSVPTRPYAELVQNISERTKVSSGEVLNTLVKLRNEGVLHEWADPPARNIAAGEPPQRPATLWYEKGPEWTDEYE